MRCSTIGSRDGLSHVSLHRAGAPCEGEFFIQWQSPYMPAPAFEFYTDPDQALMSLARFEARGYIIDTDHLGAM